MRALSPEIETILAQLKEAMLLYEGVGIAAPQLGILKRIILVQIEEKPEAFINPRLVAYEGRSIGTEGCLSFPGYLAEVERYQKITLSALNERWQPVTLTVEELTARIFQHEIDHLDGILLNERALPGTFRQATADEEELLSALG